ncbi:MAG: hypothetical protein Q9M11_08510 [Mariprofundaceae bacterium]|nr:hypothetical protein [Mariprofundaceae bacterium]
METNLMQCSKYLSYLKIPYVIIWTFFLGVMFFVPNVVLAKDTLASVLAKASQQEMVALEYREVKHMIFLHDPIEVSGRMFVAGNDFVLEQLQSQRMLLTADQHRLRFYIPSKGMRHSKMMTSSMVRKGLQFFKPLMSGDQAALERVFEIQFSVQPKGNWILILTPKKLEEAFFSKVFIEGKEGKPAYYSRLEMADGSRSEWFFSILPVSGKNKQIMQMLMQESKG